MDLFELAVGDMLLRADNGVLEIFRLGLDDGYRVPFSWLAVQPQQGRGGQLSLVVGHGDPPGPVLYGAALKVNPRSYRPVRFQPSDEPGLLAFFGQIASKVGRSVQP